MLMPSLIRKIEPGDVIGRCRIIRELGRGGVGTVYLATHQTLQIEVALKILSPSLAVENPALAERFVREAQLAARIRHPNVIAVMDAALDESTGLYYIVMEYVGGGSLSWHLRHGPLPEAKALAVITGIAQGLATAEESRVVHRDIKPDNIMLDQRGTPKLADLGLAKHDLDSSRSGMTIGGSFMGTPAYMSPDQARDARIADKRDDIYSLGATFFECLTGRAPFQGDNAYNIMSELLTKPSPRPRDFRPEISQSADLICCKMMAKSRQLRYTDAKALLNDLQLCRTLGDKALDQLEAAHFDNDSKVVTQVAQSLGVETSADGVALIPEPPDDPTKPGRLGSRRSDQHVFAAAVLLVALVMVATLLLALTGEHKTLTYIATAPSVQPTPQVAPQPVSVPTPEVIPPQPVPPASQPQPRPEAVAVTPTPEVIPQVTPSPQIVQPGVNLTGQQPDGTNAPPITPIEPTPAVPVLPDSAFAARAIAETNPDIANPGGHAKLLKVIGRRESTQPVPVTWTFYFFDKKTISNARIISVSDGKVVKNGVDIWHPLAPFGEGDVLPDDRLLTDSSDALKTAEALLPPGITVSSSECVLTQKDSVPVWKVTLWAKDPHDEELELGTVTIVAEKKRGQRQYAQARPADAVLSYSGGL